MYGQLIYWPNSHNRTCVIVATLYTKCNNPLAYFNFFHFRQQKKKDNAFKILSRKSQGPIMEFLRNQSIPLSEDKNISTFKTNIEYC